MNLIGNQKWTTLDGEPTHYCPGCEKLHCFWVFERNDLGAVWVWNKSYDMPSFTPSMNISYGNGKRCHYYIKEGHIEYLNDCSHDLAGRRIPIPDLPDWAIEEE